ncbi:MAG TPA: cytochrome c family protein [Bauldia sp.]|nr:cytochrome c family protein [Bauldia sp.]
MRGLVLALIAIVAGPLAARADGDAAKGQRVFNYCVSCHRIGPGATTLVGPELNGVVGRKAGTLPGYPYSDAMKNSGVTWDEATLLRYLRGPQAMIPGIRMTFGGIRKDEDIVNLIAYLKTFDAAGNPVAPPP